MPLFALEQIVLLSFAGTECVVVAACVGPCPCVRCRSVCERGRGENDLAGEERREREAGTTAEERRRRKSKNEEREYT